MSTDRDSFLLLVLYLNGYVCQYSHNKIISFEKTKHKYSYRNPSSYWTFFPAPFEGPQVTIPDDPSLRVPHRIRLPHVTSPYNRKIAGGLGRAKLCKQSIQLIYVLLSLDYVIAEI